MVHHPLLKSHDDEAHEARKDRPTAVYKRLREMIVHGQLAPGGRIVEAEIASRLGVSRTPVRSAIQRLEQEGFVLSGEGKKMRPTVAPLTREDSREILRIVGALEGLVAAEAAALPDSQRNLVVSDLRRVNARLRELSQQDRRDRHDFFDLDAQFHQVFVEAAAGPRLRRLLNAVKPQAERYIRLYVSLLLDEVGTSVEDHEEIIKALQAGSPEGAQLAVQSNWTNASERLRSVIHTVGERGRW